jgi:hypothetical protein
VVSRSQFIWAIVGVAIPVDIPKVLNDRCLVSGLQPTRIGELEFLALGEVNAEKRIVLKEVNGVKEAWLAVRTEGVLRNRIGVADLNLRGVTAADQWAYYAQG